jgi:cyclophilin family peptidyl-prolyl cis-trans isomerase
MKKYLAGFIVGSLLSVNGFAQKNKVEIITDSGRIVVMLYDNTPLNSENMLKNARAHVYDSLLFHRVIPNFMVQGGDPTSKHAAPGAPLGSGGLGYTIPAEINDSDFHKRGALAVARSNTPDKAGSSSQFYIVVGKKCTDAELDRVTQQTGHKFSPSQREIYKTIGGTPHLDANYTVFGEVLEGMDVVDKIVSAPRSRADRPNGDIRMLSVRELLPAPEKKKHRGLFWFLKKKKN